MLSVRRRSRAANSHSAGINFRGARHQTIEFIALRDIADGEEITTNYNGEPDDRKAVWFATLP